MRISVITLFPKMIEAFISESIISRAVKKGLVNIEIINLRAFAKDKYGTVDDRPYGGGAGMLLMAEPMITAIRSTKSQIPNPKQILNSKSKFPNQQSVTSNKLTRNSKQLAVLTSPRGRVYNQQLARKFSKLDHLIVVAGHYEGVDERVSEYIDGEISLGDFVMTGGEITAAAIIDSVIRLIPQVLKNSEAATVESFYYIQIDKVIEAVGLDSILAKLKKVGKKKVCLLEFPQYTRPDKYQNIKVPDVLLSGNHREIEKWRIAQAYKLTKKNRPDLLEL